MRTAVLLVAVLAGSCCKTCPPPRTVVVTRVDPCLKKARPEARPVPAPIACDVKTAPADCKGCLPGKVCFTLVDASVLASNVEDLQTWADTVEAQCLRGAP